MAVITLGLMSATFLESLYDTPTAQYWVLHGACCIRIADFLRRRGPHSLALRAYRVSIGPLGNIDGFGRIFFDLDSRH